MYLLYFVKIFEISLEMYERIERTNVLYVFFMNLLNYSYDIIVDYIIRMYNLNNNIS